MSLRDLKIPNFKFPKLKMKDIENIEEVNVEIDPKKINEKNKKHEYYPATNYKTVKEKFYKCSLREQLCCLHNVRSRKKRNRIPEKLKKRK